MDRARNSADVPPAEANAPRFDFHLAAAPRLLWKTRIGDSYGGARPRVAQGRLFAWDREDQLLVLDAMSGTVLDRRPVLDEVIHQTPWSIGETLYMSARKRGERSTCLCAYNWARAEVLWTRPTRFDWTAPLACEELVWARTTDDYVHALRAADGMPVWTHRLRRTYHHSSLVFMDDAVYLGGAGKAGFKSEGQAYDFQTDGYVLALDAATGEVRWMYVTRGEIWYVPAVSGAGVYAGETAGKSRSVYALTAAPRSRLGQCNWRYELDGLAQAGIVIGNVVYWGCYDGYLYALDAETGELGWRFKATASMAGDGPACVLRDWVFVGSRDGYLYGLDACSGALRWKHYVVDDEALAAETEEQEKRRAQGDAAGTENWSEDERREWEAYEASNQMSVEPEATTDDDESAVPSHIDPLAWVAEGRLYLLTKQGFLSCFDVPTKQMNDEVPR